MASGVFLRIQDKHPAVRLVGGIAFGSIGAVTMLTVLGVIHFQCLSF